MRSTPFVVLIALAAAAAAGDASPAPSAVTHLAAADVKAAFAKGKPLIEVQGYKIHASRREAPGEAEVHTADTDIIYVLEGRATIVTGGTAVSTRPTGAGEIRGARIEGGTPRTLAPGEVLVVPNGTPHQFTAVESPFLYYVVKVAAMNGGTR